jgi:2,3-bisphosphoglycerate-independent phosphoglycerate mutase
LRGMGSFGRYRVLVLPDHPTPISLRTHSADPIPFVIYSSEEKNPRSKADRFDEVSAGKTGIFVDKGHELIDRFLT